ncbi:hypothetical protein PsorP6_002486 [Peronosclerospora sorghi]|uniref:Uncharacterized protein n=1 Tax=Peronosclerospora sorghi TaxID=230839 RepID=A0ACC0WVX4_9STRA|nr:hypothetical protein PsorP6_002486 [Peronosclerospora sorghi]
MIVSSGPQRGIGDLSLDSPGTFYVQILQAQQLHVIPSVHDHATGQPSDATNATKRVYPVYARCILDEGTHMEQTFRGLDMSQVETAHDAVSVLSPPKEPRRPSKGTRFFRGLRRAAGYSGERLRPGSSSI